MKGALSRDLCVDYKSTFTRSDFDDRARKYAGPAEIQTQLVRDRAKLEL